MRQRRIIIYATILMAAAVLITSVFLIRQLFVRNVPAAVAAFSEEELTSFYEYVSKRGEEPKQYVIDKFKDHDCIFLGEFHRISHDARFVRDIIPLLYENGIRTLGYEFICSEDQEQLDTLITGKQYDKQLAMRLLASMHYYFCYREYEDILKEAWRLNSTLSDGQPRFRIVGITNRIDYSKRYGSKEDQEEYDKATKSADSHMADVIKREIIDKGEKALIYCGFNHAQTGFLWDSEFLRAGNYAKQLLGDRAMTINLYCPYVYSDGEKLRVPFKGAMEATIRKLGKPAALDMTGSPFGSLTITDSYYNSYFNHSGEHDVLKYEDLYDGIIVLDTLNHFKGNTPIREIADNEELFAYIKKQAGAPNNTSLTKSGYISILKNDADIQKRFRLLIIPDDQPLLK